MDNTVLANFHIQFCLHILMNFLAYFKDYLNNLNSSNNLNAPPLSSIKYTVRVDVQSYKLISFTNVAMVSSKDD